ncbi:MAG TPA: hypothetical protein VNF47_26255 [Streptosporangiaceae bacterium]|nr:hypothetical protein [Streptosporangiaceae bacterium]
MTADAAAPGHPAPGHPVPGHPASASTAPGSTAPGSTAPGRERAGIPWLLAWLAFLPVAVLRAGVLAESDTFWEIRTGLLTIDRRAIPTADPFSWTVHGQAWTLNSWGFNVLVAMAYKLAGLAGAAVACACLIMVAAAVTLALARTLGASALLTGALLLAGASIPLVPWLQARPELVDYTAVPALVLLLRQVVRSARPGRWLLAVAALSVIWVNLHAAALFGVAIAATSAALQLARRRTRGSGWRCALATAAAAAAAFVNPQGFALITQTARVRSASAGVVTEWNHFDPASPLQWAILAAGIVALVLTARRGDAILAAALSVAIAGALTALRIQPILVLLTVPVLAAAGSGPAVRSYVRSRRVVLYPGAAALVLAVAIVAAPSLGHLGRPDSAIYPRWLVAQIPPGCRLFNSYLLGGFVILQRPDVPVSLDSRNDIYGRARIVADERVLRGQGDIASELAGAGCVLVPPSAGLARRLARDPAWVVRAAGPAAALYVRRCGGTAVRHCGGAAVSTARPARAVERPAK